MSSNEFISYFLIEFAIAISALFVCFSIAYIFKAKAEEERKKMCETCIHKVSKEDIEKIRADAIDEFVEKANEEVYNDFNFTDIEEYSINDVALTLYRVAEQLKERKE